MPRLDQLPTEITHLIYWYTHPSAIVAFASTCRLLHNQSSKAQGQHRRNLRKYSEVSDIDSHTIPRVLIDVLREPWLAWYIKQLFICTQRRHWTRYWANEDGSDNCQRGQQLADFKSGLYYAGCKPIFRAAIQDKPDCIYEFDAWAMALSKLFSPEELLLISNAIEKHPTYGEKLKKWLIALARGDDVIYKILLISAIPDLKKLVLPSCRCSNSCNPCWVCDLLHYLAHIFQDGWSQSFHLAARIRSRSTPFVIEMPEDEQPEGNHPS